MKYIYLIIGVVIGVLYLGSLIKIILIERKIKKITKTFKEQSNQLDYIAAPADTIKRLQNNLKEKYDPVIAEMERDRRFILDKLPFFKQ